MALALFALLGLLAFANAGVPYRFVPRIVNGEEVKPGEIPYQVSLQNPGSNFHFCGGSLLNKDYVITAAHCVAGKYPQTVQVIASTVDLNDPASVHEVAQIIMHEKYNPNDSWKNDIALLKLKTPFQAKSADTFVKLPSVDEVINANDPAIVSGWGSLWQGGPSPKLLQRAHLFVTDQEQCGKVYAGVSETIHSSHICANDPETQTGACHGDSGGPLTVDGKLVGLVSWSMGCALTDYPTVYARVTSFLDWIESHAV